MSTTVLADVAVLPAALLERVRVARAAADAAERDLALLAVEWADAHPVLDDDEAWKVTLAPWSWLEHSTGELDPAAVAAAEDGDPENLEWHGIPPVRWDAPAAFASANAMSTTGGQNLIRDALVLRHRLPLLWQRVVAGEVQVWRARRVAQRLLGAPDDVVAHVDQHVTPVADRCGTVLLERLVEEALQRLHAEEREIALLEELTARYVHVAHDSIHPQTLSRLDVRAEWKDVHDFDHAVTAVAAALKRDGCDEPLDVRRAMAIGVLADPAHAQALLDDVAAADRPAPTKQVVLHLHLTDAGLNGQDPVGRCQTTRRAVLTEQIRSWCGRTDTHLTVKPVIDLNDHHDVETYEIPDRLRTQIQTWHPRCVFPWCDRPSATADLDHTIPWRDDGHGEPAGGRTSSTNLAPLCRRHHRLKTLAGWTYRPLDPHTDPGVYLWTDPHGLTYLRNPTGTIALTSSDRHPPPP